MVSWGYIWVEWLSMNVLIAHLSIPWSIGWVALSFLVRLSFVVRLAMVTFPFPHIFLLFLFLRKNIFSFSKYFPPFLLRRKKIYFLPTIFLLFLFSFSSPPHQNILSFFKNVPPFPFPPQKNYFLSPNFFFLFLICCKKIYFPFSKYPNVRPCLVDLRWARLYVSLVSCKNLEYQQYDVLLKSNWKVLDFSLRQIKPNHCYPKMVLCVWDSVKICEADFGVIDFLSPMKKWVVLLYLDLSNQALENTSSQTVPSNGQLKWEWILHISLLCHSPCDLRVLCIPIILLPTGHSEVVILFYTLNMYDLHMEDSKCSPV